MLKKENEDKLKKLKTEKLNIQLILIEIILQDYFSNSKRYLFY